MLHSIRYGDTSIIVHMITEKYGRMAFIIKGARSKKNAFHANLFFPLNILQIEAYYRSNANLQKIKEVNLYLRYNSLHNDPIKSAVIFFLAEVLYRFTQPEHINPELFEFFFNSLLYFDKIEKDYQNFHLVFLIHLLRYEGFYPTLNYSSENNTFSIQSGRFIPSSIMGPADMDENLSFKFALLLKCNYSSMHNIQLNTFERKQLLNKLIEYLQVHMHHFPTINSLPVLHEVFNR